jgi:acetolactate synthase-1/2/3 large subunit
VDSVARMILAARSPLIMIGAAASRPHLVEPLSEFVRRTSIPFFNTQMGKGAVTGGSNLYVGTAALSERDYVHDAIDRADLIIAIGHDTVEKPPFLMGGAIGGRKVIYIGYVTANVEEVFYPDAELIGDIGASVTALAERLDGKLRPDAGMLALRQKILAHINERSDSDQFPVTPQRLVRDVRAVMPEDGIVCLDNGMYKIWFARNYRTHTANTLLLDNALATMGAGLPSAIAAKLLNPDRRVLAVCGDGGFMMNSQELETAVRLKLSLVVLIIEDSAYGMIRWKQAVDHFADFGMTFGNPDFVTYADSYGARGHRIRDVAELVPTLEASFAAGGIHLVAVPIDYSENTRVLVDELGGRLPQAEPD